MNEQEQAELERLRRRQDALQAQVLRLSVDLQEMSSRLQASAHSAPDIQPMKVPALEIPPLEPTASFSQTQFSESIPAQTAVPPPLPPVIPLVVERSIDPTPVEPVVTEASSSAPPPVEPQPRETFEMKVGTYWLVRVGIVMLLTGLVFLGTYAYKNYIGKLEAGGKVALLYTASAALLGFGGWLQRKREKESLRNYGQVLFAGGLAAVYFTTYAAHYVEVLRVIASPVVDALLLLTWSVVTVWIADRRKSEVLALFAVGLSYYTSAITDVGLFTLGSNLMLTAAAVFFLVRNRWVTLSFISLAATYGGFAYWRFHQGDWSWHTRVPELWQGNYFLAGYWIFFTAAVFFARGSSLVNVNRGMFASANNAAFFGLTLLSMMHVGQGLFWKFALGFGTVLLVTAWFARKVFPEERIIRNSYLVQGLVLVTAGFIAYFTGLTRALVLAAESVVLIVLGHQQKNLFVQAGGYITAALSAVWLATEMTGERADVWLAAAIGSAFLFNAWWEQRNDPQRASSVVRPGSGYFIALAIGLCGIATWRAVSGPWLPVVWMVEAVLLAAAFHALRIPELPIFSQALAVAAQGWWFIQFALRRDPAHWPVPATFIGATLALAFLGHRQKNAFVRASAYLTAALSAMWAINRMTDSTVDLTLGAVMIAAFLLNAWWEHRHDEQRASSVVRPLSGYFVALAIGVCGIMTWRAVPNSWVAVAWMLEALVFTSVFYALRIPEVPIFAQGLALAGQGYWFFEFALRQQRPHWLVPATLIGGTLALSHWWQRQKRLVIIGDVQNLLQIVYGLALVGVLFFWFQPRFAPAAWLAFLCLLAIGVTIYGVATRAWALAACAQLFLLVSSFELFQEFSQGKPPWQYALVPLASWLVLGIATTAWLSRHDTRPEIRQPLLHVSVFYRAVAFLMSLWWIYAYVPARNQFWVLCAAGLGLLGITAWLKNREALVFSGAYLAIAYVVWFITAFADAAVVNWPNLLALVIVLAAQQIVHRTPRRFALPLHLDQEALLVSGLALWLFVSRFVVLKSGGAHFFLTVSWAGLAFLFFAAGFILRERMYRWMGLGILACAVGRVFLSDVWKLQQIYRILSFMALGVVLLALGFIYNKYQEKIRQWL